VDYRRETAAQEMKKAGKKAQLVTTDYRRAMDVKGLEAVLTPSSWTSHVQICLDAMERGLYVGTEVGGATSLQ